MMVACPHLIVADHRCSAQRRVHVIPAPISLHQKLLWRVDRSWRASMNLGVSFGSAREIGRIRLDKIGGSADVQEAWSIYLYIALLR